MSVKKVLIITNVPQDYRTSLFNEMHFELKRKGIQLKVVFAAAGYKRRKQKLDFSDMHFDFEMLRSFNFHLGNIEKTMFTYSGVSHVISKYKPDKIIVTGYSIATLRCWLLSYIKPINYIIWSGSLEQKGRMDSTVRVILRKRFISRASGFIAYGSKAKEYLQKMGAAADKITIGLNTVDTAFYAESTQAIRAVLALPAIRHLTYIGYLSPRKNAVKLLQVVKLLSQKRTDFVLDIIGDGSDKPKLMDFVKQENLGKYVQFHGFKQKKDLPAFLAISDCFLFQTDFDIWGLVLNEAMAAGVVCIASIKAGATTDLVKEGETGFAVNFDDTAWVVEKINFILDNPGERNRIALNASRFIKEYASVSISADGFIRALEIDKVNL